MNSEAFMDDFICKPKINRLPPSLVQDLQSDKKGPDNSLFKWMVVGVFSLSLLIIGYNYSSVSPDDARLLALVNSSEDPLSPKDSALYFKDNGGAIAGQMVKIAPESEKVEPNTILGTGKAPDKQSERELMSILGKY